MALVADYGFVLWDGKSAGSINNVLELLKGKKSVVVYFAPEKGFYTLKRPADVYALLRHCEDQDYQNISKKIHFDRRLQDLESSFQETLHL